MINIKLETKKKRKTWSFGIKFTINSPGSDSIYYVIMQNILFTEITNRNHYMFHKWETYHI